MSSTKPVFLPPFLPHSGWQNFLLTQNLLKHFIAFQASSLQRKEKNSNKLR